MLAYTDMLPLTRVWRLPKARDMTRAETAARWDGPLGAREAKGVTESKRMDVTGSPTFGPGELVKVLARASVPKIKEIS